MSTEIGLKRFDKLYNSLKSGEVERSSSSGKDREFGVTVLAGTGRVFQEMLSNSRVMGGDLRSAVFLQARERLERSYKLRNPSKPLKSVLVSKASL